MAGSLNGMANPRGDFSEYMMNVRAREGGGYMADYWRGGGGSGGHYFKGIGME